MIPTHLNIQHLRKPQAFLEDQTVRWKPREWKNLFPLVKLSFLKKYCHPWPVVNVKCQIYHFLDFERLSVLTSTKVKVVMQSV